MTHENLFKNPNKYKLVPLSCSSVFRQSFQRGLFIIVQELIYKLHHLPLWTHTHTHTHTQKNQPETT